MTTIKNVTEGKKKSSKVYLEFLVPIKSTIVTEGRKGKRKIKKIQKKSMEQVRK